MMGIAEHVRFATLLDKARRLANNERLFVRPIDGGLWVVVVENTRWPTEAPTEIEALRRYIDANQTQG